MSTAPKVSGFVPALEGLRAVAAVGVLTTHVAFQTGSVSHSLLGPVWGRLDLMVALFFALSGFLLWRPHAGAARGERHPPRARRYYAHRVVRIWPAYAIGVVVILALMPQNQGVGPVVWLANLTLTQIYVPLTLTSGLTQMWSLAVEVSFYLLLPLVAVAMVRCRGVHARWRAPILVAAAILALGWAPVAQTLPLRAGITATNWLPGYVPWFATGALLAEMAADPSRGKLATLASRRVPMALAAVAAYAVACTPVAGPVGLAPISAPAFAAKTACGAVFAFGLMAPLIFGDHRHRLLASPPMLAAGRWSYGVFIWHVAVLSAVFGLFGIFPFSGSMPLVWVLTVLLSLGLGAVSYGFVEEPLRRALRREEATHAAVSSAVNAGS